MADAIDNKLAEEELSIPRKTKQVKLHMTVLNTKYLEDGTGTNEKVLVFRNLKQKSIRKKRGRTTPLNEGK